MRTNYVPGPIVLEARNTKMIEAHFLLFRSPQTAREKSDVSVLPCHSTRNVAAGEFFQRKCKEKSRRRRPEIGEECNEGRLGKRNNKKEKAFEPP